MKALVLGATGLLGSQTARILSESGQFEEIILGSRSLRKVPAVAELNPLGLKS